jgi:UDP-N-acetylmuramoyl-tripeptide--D-alanyl-D-alanine ligase
MITLDAKTTAEILQGELLGDNVIFVGVSIDSRNLTAGNLFVAIMGASLDGHGYVAGAAQAGAVAVLVERPCEVACPQIIVANTTLALGLLAKYWREQFAIPIVGITGSCGKTTTTQMTGAILRQIGPTLVPIGNKNNQFGVPLTLFNLNAGHQYAVIEIYK